MGTFENYTLATLRSAVLAEFGLEGNSINNAMADDKINEAIHWINRVRDSWPWLVHEFIINTSTKISGTIDLTEDSDTYANASVALTPGMKLVVGSVGYSTEADAYRVKSYSAGGGTLTSPYTGSTVTGASFTAYTDIYPLPTDCARIIRLYDTVRPLSVYDYKDPIEFDRIRSRMYSGIYSKHYYTITAYPVDPYADTSDPVFYLNLYPYPETKFRIKGIYHRDVKNLTADGDIPVIPRKHRLVVQYVASWLLAIKLKEPVDVVRNYMLKVESGLKDMMNTYSFSEDEEQISSLSLEQGLPYDFPIQ